jgi:hypothetical protein
VSVRRRLGSKAQLEVEASYRLGKWSKATLCRWRQRLQGKIKAPERCVGNVGSSRGRRRLQRRRLQGKVPSAVAATGEGEAQQQRRKERRWRQKKGAAAAKEGGCGTQRQHGKERRWQNGGGGQELTHFIPG